MRQSLPLHSDAERDWVLDGYTDSQFDGGRHADADCDLESNRYACALPTVTSTPASPQP